MKNKKKPKIHIDKFGREYVKEHYFVRGKMKFYRTLVVDGIPANDFYEQNASDLDFFINGDYELMKCEQEPLFCRGYAQLNKSVRIVNDDIDDLPF